MSQRSFAISGGIESHTGSVNHLLEIRIADRRVRNKIHAPPEQVFQVNQKPEIPIGGIGWSQMIELHDKIDVALVRAEIRARCRANDVQARHSIFRAKRVKFRAVLFDQRDHGKEYSTNLPLAAPI